jgi:hypothetical protein
MAGRPQSPERATPLNGYENLAHHWTPAMHIFTLSDKPLERSDIIKILSVFVPKA